MHVFLSYVNIDLVVVCVIYIFIVIFWNEGGETPTFYDAHDLYKRVSSPDILKT